MGSGASLRLSLFRARQGAKHRSSGTRWALVRMHGSSEAFALLQSRPRKAPWTIATRGKLLVWRVLGVRRKMQDAARRTALAMRSRRGRSGPGGRGSVCVEDERFRRRAARVYDPRRRNRGAVGRRMGTRRGKEACAQRGGAKPRRPPALGGSVKRGATRRGERGTMLGLRAA